MNAEINVTPLVDVCLVLLIIFMIVIPSMVNGVDVQLPETRGGSDVAERTLPVTIKADGTVYLDTIVVRRDEVPSSLKRLRLTESARPIAVRGDKRVPYGDVLEVLDACREAGWQDVSLIGRAEATAARDPQSPRAWRSASAPPAASSASSPRLR